MSIIIIIIIIIININIIIIIIIIIVITTTTTTAGTLGDKTRKQKYHLHDYGHNLDIWRWDQLLLLNFHPLYENSY